MNPIGFNLIQISTDQYAIIQESYHKDDEEIGLTTEIGFKIDAEQAFVLCSVIIKFLQKELPFIIIKVSCEFKIEKNCWNQFKSENEIIIPKGFLSHLAMVTVGTTRGILHSKTENTEFNQFVIPLINVSDLISEDGIFKLA